MSAAPGRRPRRLVLVVPRREVGVYEYLRRSLAATPDIEVVLDRRLGGAHADARVSAERRSHDRAGHRPILMCALVQPREAEAAPSASASPAEPATAPAPPETPTYRTLLWPGLRIDRL